MIHKKRIPATKHSAFTMLELVMVIVVLGILAALALPRMDRDLRQEAADNVLSAIRYTQHLALVDDKTDPFDGNWQQKLWTIHFTTATSGSYYTVSSDLNKSGLPVEKKETAIDPSNGKYMYHHHNNPIQANESQNVLLGKKYGVGGINLSGTGCTQKHIAFDQLGRPHNRIGAAANDYNTYMTSDCIITFTMSDGDTFDINISKETGYAFIVGYDDS